MGVWACSILPEHIHLVVARHRYEIEQVANLLKGIATRQLREEGIHPQAAYAKPGKRPPRAFAEHDWHVFLDSDEAIRRAIKYVEENPMREGLPRQTWSFVTTYQGV